MPSLAASRSNILQRWFELIIASYPGGVGNFLGSESDRFANPVGQTIHRQIERLFDGLTSGASLDELTPALDDIVRIRAVQDFTPSQAVGFVLQLKRAAREVVGTEPSRELSELDNHVDSALCRAFDIYMSCREKIYELKANEIRRRTFKLLERLQGEEESPDGEG